LTLIFGTDKIRDWREEVFANLRMNNHPVARRVILGPTILHGPIAETPARPQAGDTVRGTPILELRG
jgi:hypothetical protein